MLRKFIMSFLSLGLVFSLVQVTFADEYTKLLIHSDHPIGSAIEDSSGGNHPISINGDVHHSGSQAKFGMSSIYFDGNGDCLSIPDSEDWNFGSGDFTIECWVYLSGSYVTRRIIQQATINNDMNTDQAFDLLLNSQKKILFLAWNSSHSIFIYLSSDITLSANEWHHIAVVKSGDMAYLFIDGVQRATDTTVSDTIHNSSLPITIGAEYRVSSDAFDNYWSGYIDELRISKGIARWTSNFDPPTAPYGTPQGPIVSISADPQTIDYGQSTTLSWNATDADTCVIEPGIGEVGPSGTTEVSPSTTTVYTITATNAAGSSSSGVTVFVESEYDASVFKVAERVGIGTLTPQSELAVNGTITAREVVVTDAGWADFVFDEGYRLPSLEDVESYINRNRRLPDIPSEKDIKEKGLSVSEVLSRQMQKIEELTLYIIQLHERIEALEKQGCGAGRGLEASN